VEHLFGQDLSSAHCWVLRGHPVEGSSPAAAWSGSSNARLVRVVEDGGSGVRLCVECCIVDASILLWSSV
jgi:hypothetical protein